MTIAELLGSNAGAKTFAVSPYLARTKRLSPLDSNAKPATYSKFSIQLECFANVPDIRCDSSSMAGGMLGKQWFMGGKR